MAVCACPQMFCILSTDKFWRVLNVNGSVPASVGPQCSHVLTNTEYSWECG